MTKSLFNKKSFDKCLSLCTLRKSLIKNLNKIPFNNTVYTNFISVYQGIEITPDISIFSYEETLEENEYLIQQYPEVSANKWLIGSTGQGDSWLIDKESGHIFFYDHDNGEYSNEGFTDLLINFEKFIQLGFLCKDIEDYTDMVEPTEDFDEQVEISLKSVHESLYELYPFGF